MSTQQKIDVHGLSVNPEMVEPLQAVLAPLDTAMRRDMALLGLGLALALTAAHLFARRFVLGPTARLAAMAKDMAAGDLSRRSGLAEGGDGRVIVGQRRVLPAVR